MDYIHCCVLVLYSPQSVRVIGQTYSLTSFGLWVGSSERLGNVYVCEVRLFILLCVSHIFFKIMTLEENIHDRIKFYEQNVIEIREEIDKKEQYSAEWEHTIDSLKFVKEKLRLLNYLLNSSSNCG